MLILEQMLRIYRIMKLAEKRDIIVTQDYGLASLGLANKCTVLHHNGYSYTNENIDQLLQTRYLSEMARKIGKRTKGPKSFTSEDMEKFRELFKRAISSYNFRSKALRFS